MEKCHEVGVGVKKLVALWWFCEMVECGTRR